MSKGDLKLDWATIEATRYACVNWHYSGVVPSGKLVKIGVWEDERFIGVVLFGRGVCNHLAHRYGCDATNACELVRVALTQHKTPVSRIISIALGILRKRFPSMRLVISFASQDEGHHGGIYQAGNWVYSGLTGHKDEFLFKGKRATDRVVSGFVKETRVSRCEWERKGVLVRLPTKQKHRYLMPLDREMCLVIDQMSKPYPKRGKQAMADTYQHSGGVAPTATLQKTGETLAI